MGKEFNTLREGLMEARASYKDVRDWVFDKLENTELDSEEMKKQFEKKFGRSKVKDFEKAVDEYLGEDVGEEDLVVTEATDPKMQKRVLRALNNSDVQISASTRGHPSTKSDFVLHVYSKKEDENVAFILGVDEVAGDYMS